MGNLVEVYADPNSGRQAGALRDLLPLKLVSDRASQISGSSRPVMIGALILLALIQLPLAWLLAQRVHYQRAAWSVS